MVSHKEPFKKLAHQGMILGEDSQKMSKSRGNTANPDKLRDKYGADTIRVYITFLGPLEKDKPWSPHGIEGSRRFLERVYRLCFNEQGEALPETGQASPRIKALLNKTIKKVTEDIESLNLNTAISAMMILVNELYRQKTRDHKILKTLAQLLQPFAPHIAEEIWAGLGGKGFVCLSPWPTFQKELLQEGERTMGVQVNGKLRGTITCSLNLRLTQALKKAQEVPAIKKAIQNKPIKKSIYKPGRILNIIT